MGLCACQLGFRLALQSSEIIWRASYPYEGIGRPYYVWCLVLEGFTCGAHSQALACAPGTWWRRCKGRTCLSMGSLGLVVEGVGEHLRILLVCWVWIRIYMCDCQQQQQQQQQQQHKNWKFLFHYF